MVSINSIGSKIYGGLTKLEPQKKLCRWFKKDPVNALALSTIASVAIKDGVGCAMYVTQSINNKKIPEKRRKFVAALDLTNGILMIVSQIGMFFAMRKLNDKCFHKLFNKVFDKTGAAFKVFAEQVRADQKAQGLTPMKKYILKRGYDSIKNDTFGVFKFVTELAAATIFAKRILVPFIATPLAGKVEKIMNKHSAEDKVEFTGKDANTQNNEDLKNVKTEVVEPEDNQPTNLLERYRQNNK